MVIGKYDADSPTEMRSTVLAKTIKSSSYIGSMIQVTRLVQAFQRVFSMGVIRKEWDEQQ